MINHNVKFDQNKPDVELVLGDFSRALLGVSEVGTIGSKIYSRHGWLGVPNGVERYNSASFRHKLKRQSGEMYDMDTGLLHSLHEAWNVLAVAELTIKELGEEGMYLPLTKSNLYCSFEYDRDGTGKLTYKSSGKEAGYTDEFGERIVSYGGKVHKVSTLAWLMVYGFIPVNIKHADGDITNNRISNLLGESSMDVGTTKVKTSRFVGVYFDKNRNNWRSDIRIGKSRIYLGSFDMEEDARDVYLFAKSIKEDLQNFLDSNEAAKIKPQEFQKMKKDNTQKKGKDLADEQYDMELDDFLSTFLVTSDFKKVVEELLESLG
jgi:hypothetical protein